MNISYLLLLKNSVIRNEQYTSGGSNWKEFWEDTTGELFAECVVCEKQDAVLGGHVSGLGFHGVGIVPLCAGCNNRRGLEMKTRADTKMVCIPEQEFKRILQKKQEELDKASQLLSSQDESEVPQFLQNLQDVPEEDEFVHVQDDQKELPNDCYYKTSRGNSGKYHLRYNCYGAKVKVTRKNVPPSKICKDCAEKAGGRSSSESISG